MKKLRQKRLKQFLVIDMEMLHPDVRSCCPPVGSRVVSLLLSAPSESAAGAEHPWPAVLPLWGSTHQTSAQVPCKKGLAISAQCRILTVGVGWGCVRPASHFHPFLQPVLLLPCLPKSWSFINILHPKLCLGIGFRRTQPTALTRGHAAAKWWCHLAVWWA